MIPISTLDDKPDAAALSKVKKQLKTKRKVQRYLCFGMTVLLILALIGLGVCFVLSLVVYPQKQSQQANKVKLYEFDFTGASSTECSSVCSSNSFECTQPGVPFNRTFALPDDWNNDLTTMDDWNLDISFGSTDCARSWLHIYSNDVLLHYQEISKLTCRCTLCQHCTRFIEGIFHPLLPTNTTWTQKGKNNQLSLVVDGGQICISHVQLKIRYSTAIFSGYASVINKLWYAGIGLSIFSVAIPLIFFGQAVSLCRSSSVSTVAYVFLPGQGVDVTDDASPQLI